MISCEFGISCFLVIRGCFNPQVAASGMDDQIFVIIIVNIDFYEMIAAAERSEAQLCVIMFDLAVTPQLCQIDFLIYRMGSLPN